MGNKDLVTFTFAFVVAFVLAAVLTGCGQPLELPAMERELPSSGQMQSIGYDVIREKIITPKCLACHANAGSYSSLMASGWIIAKQPEQSSLYLKTASGQMPKGGSPLSGAEVTAIYEWISAGAPEASITSNVPPTGNAPPSAPGNTPGTPPGMPGSANPGAPEPTFAWIQANVFTPKCIICHRGASASAGLDLSTFAGVKASTRVVAAGNSASSALYLRVANNTMPPGGPALSDEVKAAIAKWIDDGAMENGTPPSGPQPTPPPLPPLEPKFASIQANILTPRCVGCHSSSNASGGVILQDYASVMRQVRAGRAESSELYKVLEDNDMPRSGSPLTFTQKETIRQWINAGADNN